MVIIDSPGLGESDLMDEVLMNYIPNAFAFIYVIDVSHAGGVNEDLKNKVNTLLHLNSKLSLFNVRKSSLWSGAV